MNVYHISYRETIYINREATVTAHDENEATTIAIENLKLKNKKSNVENIKLSNFYLRLANDKELQQHEKTQLASDDFRKTNRVRNT